MSPAITAGQLKRLADQMAHLNAARDIPTGELYRSIAEDQYNKVRQEFQAAVDAALTAAEAQPVQEPVAWFLGEPGNYREVESWAEGAIPFYTAPPQPVPLPSDRQPFGDLRNAKWLDPECYGAGACQSLKFKAQPVQELADETGWLIEMCVNGHTLWWGGEFDNNEVAWSRCRPWSTDSHRLIARLVSDAYKAVRFARREDAQKALDGLLTARPCPLLQNAPEVYSVQEHMWPASKVEVQSEQPVPLTDEQRAEVLDALPKADERETVVCCITGSTLRALARAHGIGGRS